MIQDVLLFVGAILLAYIAYRFIQGRPELFKAAVLDQAFGTLAWLALGLMAGITFCIYLLRQL